MMSSRIWCELFGELKEENMFLIELMHFVSWTNFLNNEQEGGLMWAHQSEYLGNRK